MLEASDLKRGMIVKISDAPCRVLDISMHAPSARGASMRVKTRIRNMITGQVLDINYKAEDKVDEADFERRKGQYLYAAGDSGVFMDMDSYDQFEIDAEMFEPVRGFLLDGAEVQLGLYEGRIISIDPPQVVILTVTQTAPALKNATAQAQTKEALLETGLRLQVPPYLESGEKIKVDTRDGHFVSRA